MRHNLWPLLCERGVRPPLHVWLRDHDYAFHWNPLSREQISCVRRILSSIRRFFFKQYFLHRNALLDCSVSEHTRFGFGEILGTSSSIARADHNGRETAPIQGSAAVGDTEVNGTENDYRVARFRLFMYEHIVPDFLR